MKLQKTQLGEDKKFSIEDYEESGMFHNETTDDIVIANKRLKFVLFIGKYQDFDFLDEPEEKAEEEQIPKLNAQRGISEEFVLKLTAVLTAKNKLRKFDI